MSSYDEDPDAYVPMILYGGILVWAFLMAFFPVIGAIVTVGLIAILVHAWWP